MFECTWKGDCSERFRREKRNRSARIRVLIADVIEALEAARASPFDAVISDVLMPRMDGYRLCYEIRRDKNLLNFPDIIYTSTFTSSGDEHLALTAGADRFIRKPADAKAILGALSQLCEQPGRRSGARARTAP